jgi:Flp pilus assembly protein TadG
MKLFRKRLDESGATAVEFALIAPVAIVMMFSAIECGRLMFSVNELEASLSEAARKLMIDPEASNTEVRTALCSRMVLVDCDAVTFTAVNQTVNGRSWRAMTVSTPFDSPLSHLLPLPESLTQSQRVPILSS